MANSMSGDTVASHFMMGPIGALPSKTHMKAPALLHQVEYESRAHQTPDPQMAPALLHPGGVESRAHRSQDFIPLSLKPIDQAELTPSLQRSKLFPSPTHTTMWHFDNVGIFSMRPLTNYPLFITHIFLSSHL